jgi:PAS domain-containing protein
MKSWPGLEMLVINRAYEEAYGIEAASYVGQNDGTIWGEDTAAHFNEADRAASESNGAVTRHETFLNPRTGTMETTTSIKWPVRINGAVVGIAGIITERKMAGGLALAAPEDQ